MRLFWLRYPLVFVLVASGPLVPIGWAHSVSAKDGLGRVIRLARPANRIVTLAPNATEIVASAGAMGEIVGDSAYSNWPSSARRLPKVSNAFRIDLERIVQLHPNLIVAWASSLPIAAEQALERLGYPVFVLRPRSLKQIAREVLDVGNLAGTATRAKAFVTGYLSRLMRLSRRYSGLSTVSVFYEISGKPLYTIGGEQLISKIIRLCGGRNIFSPLSTLAPVVTRASVLASNPDVILTGSGPFAHQRLRAWSKDPWLAAVRGNNLFVLPAALLGQPGPRVLQGAAMLCRDLQKARRRRDG